MIRGAPVKETVATFSSLIVSYNRVDTWLKYEISLNGMTGI
jgi:hypothetical protein